MFGAVDQIDDLLDWDNMEIIYLFLAINVSFTIYIFELQCIFQPTVDVHKIYILFINYE